MQGNGRAATYFEIETEESDGDAEYGDYHDDENDDELYIHSSATPSKSQKSKDSHHRHRQRAAATAKDDDEEISLIIPSRRSHPSTSFFARFPYLPMYCCAMIIVIILVAAIVLTPTSPQVELHRHCEADYTAAFARGKKASTWNDMVTYFLEQQDQQTANMDKHTSAPSRCHEVPPGKKCTCKNPIIGSIQQKRTSAWKEAFDVNLAYLKEYETTDENSVISSVPLDVVLLGDSITEHWQGTSSGRPNPNYADSHEVYQNLFVHNLDSIRDDVSSSSTSTPIQGLALGVSGDRIPQVLYRLENGILSSAIQPKVWWLLIGTNDMAYGDWCSVDAVVAGIVRITQTVLQARPKSTVVINSILPLGAGDGSLKSWYGYYDQANYKLECFAASTDHVEFYNATSFFLNHYDNTNDNDAETNNARPASVNMTLLPDGCHPVAEGYQIWGTGIIEKVKQVTGRGVYQKPADASGGV